MNKLISETDKSYHNRMFKEALRTGFYEFQVKDNFLHVEDISKLFYYCVNGVPTAPGNVEMIENDNGWNLTI